MKSLTSFTKFLSLAVILAVTCFASKSAVAQDEVSIGEEIGINLCAAVFPCHIKTGRLLPGFTSGTECNWAKTCESYRKSSSFIKLRKKLKQQNRISKRKSVEIKSRV